MKMKLLIATADSDYAEHLSGVLSEKHSETFELFVCTSADRLHKLLSGGKFEIALADPEFVSSENFSSVSLLLALSDQGELIGDGGGDVKKICKYQRISSIVGNIFEHYSKISGAINGSGTKISSISAVWSPSGGSGKTTVALAYACRKVSEGKKATYLNMENFASTPAYFQGMGKSISKIFENFESNIRMFVTAVRQTDALSGISYFGEPENYEDMNILSENDIENLILACAAETEELVVDLSSGCDARTKKVFELADAVLVVCDPSSTSQAKLKQFANQHDIFGKIKSKIVLINNKGAEIQGLDIERSIQLPFVNSEDPVSIFKFLANEIEDWRVKMS
ncbi:MAG: hypothetical protein FWG34_06055 [Oscillospiraceae bacterium]|nr:hypothetical protein [Oscillospiraceae bacterium]